MKIAIDCGHGVNDIGATGIKQEDNLTLEVGNKLKDYLIGLGHSVIMCRPKAAIDLNNSLFLRCEAANKSDANIFVSIHFNASVDHLGHGTEVYAISNTGKQIALNVVNEIAKLGFTNRGVKDGSHLYVLKYTDMTSLLIECCFIDNKEDMNRLDIDKMARAIVKGLTNEDVKPISITKLDEWDSHKMTTIRTLQVLCNIRGFLDKNKNKLAVDGVLGQLTLSALPVLKMGSKLDSFIKLVQGVLILKGYDVGYGADGIFGACTEKAVEKFQADKKLVVDGIIGINTWTKLLY